MLTVDYTVELSVNVGGPSFPLRVSTRDDKPMKLRYRGVGVEVDTAAADWWNGIGLVTRDSVPEVVDPGSWQLGPPLDDLLRVTGVRSGPRAPGSRSTSPCRLDLGRGQAQQRHGAGGVRAVRHRRDRAARPQGRGRHPRDPQGRGRRSVVSGGMHAGVALEIVPLKVAALADLVLGDAGFVALTVGVRFPAALPFANSGLGLYGLPAGSSPTASAPWSARARRGQAGARLAREAVDQESTPREPGQYALGLGAVIGTAPDAGFTFNAQGMVTVEFPRPAVIFSVIATVDRRDGPGARRQVPAPIVGGLSIIGLVVIDDTAVTIAMRGRYADPRDPRGRRTLRRRFPYIEPDRVVPAHRHRQPARPRGLAGDHARSCPASWTSRPRRSSWCTATGCSGLGGNDDFIFQGFSVGFGAGFGIDWSAGPIRLTASAEVLAGFGTTPFFLAAGIWVRGELDLVV